MATIFQKIFLPKAQINILNLIDTSTVQAQINDDIMNMYKREQYTIDTSSTKITATHNWHHAQGDMYRLNIVKDGKALNTTSESAAKRIFTHMQNKYRQQQH